MNPLAAAAPLLQTRYQFLSTPDTRSTVIFLATTLGFVGLITVGGIVARQRHRHLDPQVRRKLGRRAFIRTARGLGLQPHHIQTLEHLVRVAKVQRPFLLFTSAGLLDELLRTARARGDHEVILNAQTSAAPFYQRAGFVPRGETFVAAGVPHVEMRRAL